MSVTLLDILSIAFWSGVLIVFYAYIGYGIILWILVKIKRLFASGATEGDKETGNLPKVTFIVCAYNESSCISEKINNSLLLDYPSEHIRFVVITDGSTDDTPQKALATFQAAAIENYFVLHKPERKGKIAAFHRAMTELGHWKDNENTHIIVSTDANTLLNTAAVKKMVDHFKYPQIGAVAGEKRILMGEKDAASAAGEGIYWKYESLLKKWDAELWSVVGAAGELFALRANLYEPAPSDTIVEDFYMTMKIAQKGFRVAYEPGAYAAETSSASIDEEMKRKIRIAAGGLQAVVRLAPLLNIFKYRLLSFQYISHRVLRWTAAPLLLPVLMVLNLLLAYYCNRIYLAILVIHLLFYVFAAIGYLFERRQIKVKALFIPYYFCLMNYAMYAGFFRLIRGRQTVLWEKSARANN